jgi:hypothetical protein
MLLFLGISHNNILSINIFYEKLFPKGNGFFDLTQNINIFSNSHLNETFPVSYDSTPGNIEFMNDTITAIISDPF